MKSIKSKLAIVSAVVVAALAPVAAFAVAPDYSGLTSAVTFDAVTTAFVAIGGILMAMYVVWKGVKLIISMLKTG